ncbi:hypothetical protein C6V83_06760 [Gordonia iterans]|uniref:Uncharacterized protein n=1 Tax=Gordonia iterans TaxID=1004901 RepID=A0A2S0KEB4_9ACTN|nr:hypothetical protein C6V83_06760 [Gordonia iterans]
MERYRSYLRHRTGRVRLRPRGPRLVRHRRVRRRRPRGLHAAAIEHQGHRARALAGRPLLGRRGGGAHRRAD